MLLQSCAATRFCAPHTVAPSEHGERADVRFERKNKNKKIREKDKRRATSDRTSKQARRRARDEYVCVSPRSCTDVAAASTFYTRFGRNCHDRGRPSKSRYAEAEVEVEAARFSSVLPLSFPSSPRTPACACDARTGKLAGPIELARNISHTAASVRHLQPAIAWLRTIFVRCPCGGGSLQYGHVRGCTASPTLSFPDEHPTAFKG